MLIMKFREYYVFGKFKVYIHYVCHTQKSYNFVLPDAIKLKKLTIWKKSVVVSTTTTIIILYR